MLHIKYRIKIALSVIISNKKLCFKLNITSKTMKSSK